MKQPVKVDVYVRGSGKQAGFACDSQLSATDGGKVRVFKKSSGGKPIGTFLRKQVVVPDGT